MTKKTAIVTGVSRGIGLAIGKKFSEIGYYVIGTSTTGSSEEFQPDECWRADFSDGQSLHHFLERLRGLPRIDALVNNAGINIIKKQAEVSPDDYTAIENINLRAPYFIASAAAEKMAQTGGGRIVNIASIWSVVTKEKRTLYSTMKSGLHGLTRSMAAEWADKNILINTVSPGFVNTSLTQKSLGAEEIKALADKIPLKRLAEPAEIAELVIFLAGNSNTYLTGQNIVIDGAFSIV